ncbi:MAG TPA: glycosyltransferase family 2 protein [Bacillota bacterium]
MKLTAVIPVYRDPKRVSDIVRKLLASDYPNHEIVIVVDGETNSRIEEALAPYREQIRIHYNQAQLGKSASLNRIAAELRTDLLLFLDNDILLPGDPGFVTRVVSVMQDCDISELPKEAVAVSLISKMMRYEFLGFAMTTYVLSKLSGRCPAMNGAAFAVRKELFDKLGGFKNVVNEDMDFAARSFRQGARFSYNPRLKVENEVPTTLAEWVKQRKRWALNNVLWLRNNFRLLAAHFFKSFSFFISGILLLLPFFTYMVVFALMKRVHLTPFLPVLFMTAQHIHMSAGLLLWLTQLNLIFGEGLVPTLMGLSVSSLIYFGFAKFLRFRFNFLEYLLFYFIYSPIWLLANIIVWVGMALKIDIQVDWKV